MSGTRALFASIGAGVSLAAAAALSLLAVSAVFAFGGWSDPVISSVQNTTVTLGAVGGSSSSEQETLVLPARKERAAPRRTVTRRRPAAPAQADQPQVSAAQPAVVSAPPKVSLTPKTDQDPKPATTAPAATQQRKSIGDSVRAATNGLSATVNSTGDALAGITAPLAPPVSSAVQKITNMLVELLRRAGEDVGGILNRVLPAK